MNTIAGNSYPVDDVELPSGDVLVRPMRDGHPIKDPFCIFKNPKQAISDMCEWDKGQTFDETGYIPLRSNMVVNLGRQTIANLIGGRDFSADPTLWVITKCSWGTYDEVPRFTDVTLSPQPDPGVFAGGSNEIAYDGVNTKKQLTSVDWPQPFIVRFEANLEENEANGYLIREMGLWTSNENLFARKAFTAIEKVSDFSLSFLWRIRT